MLNIQKQLVHKNLVLVVNHQLRNRNHDLSAMSLLLPMPYDHEVLMHNLALLLEPSTIVLMCAT